MNAIYSAEQLKTIDANTLVVQQISEIELVKKAATTLFKAIRQTLPKTTKTLHLLVGNGNNGADALALACLFNKQKIKIFIYTYPEINKNTPLLFLKKCMAHKAIHIKTLNEFEPVNCPQACLIDGFLGSGTNRPLGMEWHSLAQAYNESKALKIAIDVPTGLAIDWINTMPANGLRLKSDFCFSLGFHKWTAFSPDTDGCQWQTLPFPLSVPENINPIGFLIEQNTTKPIQHSPFTYKKDLGVHLLFAGSNAYPGAGFLATKAASLGSGILYLSNGYDQLNHIAMHLPEVIPLNVQSINNLSKLQNYTAFAIGPGFVDYVQDIMPLLVQLPQPKVIDAAAIGWLASNKEAFHNLDNAILTPHFGEAKQLFGTSLGFGSIICCAQKWIEAGNNRIVILKQAHTHIVSKEGVFILEGGLPILSKGGSGDILTGLLLGNMHHYRNLNEISIASVCMQIEAAKRASKLHSPHCFPISSLFQFM